MNASVQWGYEFICVVSITIRYTHFHWLIVNLKRSRREVTRKCFEWGCIRYFHERQKQTMSEMKELILIRLLLTMCDFGKEESLHFSPHPNNLPQVIIIYSQTCYKSHTHPSTRHKSHITHYNSPLPSTL